MFPSRRLSNGRSPLVRKQCQITSFFSPGKSPAPNSNPNPSPSISPNTSSLDDKATHKKPLLVITPPSVSSIDSCSSVGNKAPYSSEVVGKRIRVYWPLDKAWYEGHVRSFDEVSGKHVIQYDDGEEEFLDIEKEKIEWVEAERPRNLRRLRRMSGSGSPAADKPLESVKAGAEEGSSKEASTGDEEWGRGSREDDMEDDSEDVELENEDDMEEDVVSRSRRNVALKLSSRAGKRRKIAVEKMDCIRTVKFDDQEDNTEYKTPVDARRSNLMHHDNSIGRNQLLDVADFSLTGEVADRFGKRHAEKFKFLGVERKDAHGRRPGDEDYDPRTLYLPQEFLKSLSGGQRQWWEFKSKHMDKVLFFKMGKFYELFEMDAHIGARELDLQYMKGDQPHCGFPEKNFLMNLEKLAMKGYRVLVVEQTETPDQLELRRKEMGTKDKVVKREICAVVTKGTLVEGETLLTRPDASYLMSVTEKCQKFDEHNTQGTVLGICVVDVSTSKFMLGQFEDNLERDCLCSILSELRPVEIIKPVKVLSTATERVLMHNTRNPLVNDLVPSSEFWNAEKTILEIKKIYSPSKHSGKSGMMDDGNGVHNLGDYPGLPCILSELDSAGQNGSLALSALGGCLFYLRQAFLDETLLKCAKFEALQCVGSLGRVQKPYMILDAPALENLEILENRLGNPAGTLYAQLDNCVTAFGKRLLKSWLARPLYDPGSILARQDAVSGFKGVSLAYALEFRKMLSRLPDMERLLARHFASCEAFGRNASAIILYEDAARKKLMEFLGKGLPDVSKILKFFKDAFDWSEAEQSGRIIPHEGCDSDYDAVCKTISEVESGLMKHLNDQRKLLGNSSINYVTVGKDTYLLEVPENLMSAVPQNYELRSSKKLMKGDFCFFSVWWTSNFSWSTMDLEKFVNYIF
ncbi:hypothetical protein IEQ34_004277 [Dendrobium chrysotoxum]|uniref:DNA mismatch repair protein n=1 Tax=Dendrobium chrysotoxum TaxID=161865 RepID=A0AAV7GZU0_DENCH|nr:hypothetical protein IEQ34_004277 [Dendrobium chrysotoxum]